MRRCRQPREGRSAQAVPRCGPRYRQGNGRQPQQGRSPEFHLLRHAVNPMSGQEVLNQDEIDALLNGVDAGAVSTEAPPAPGEARHYDFSSEMRIVRGRMPTLEMVNERFARQLRISLYNLLRRTVELAVGQ